MGLDLGTDTTAAVGQAPNVTVAADRTAAADRTTTAAKTASAPAVKKVKLGLDLGAGLDRSLRDPSYINPLLNADTPKEVYSIQQTWGSGQDAAAKTVTVTGTVPAAAPAARLAGVTAGPAAAAAAPAAVKPSAPSMGLFL